MSTVGSREAREQERRRFFELADRLTRSHDLEEQSRVKEELARLTFGNDAEDPSTWPHRQGEPFFR